MSNVKQIINDGIWYRNSGLVQLLGLCPLLAVTTTTTYALGLGLATTIVMVLSNTVISLLRGFVASYLRILIYVLVIASLVTAIDILMQAWFFDLHRTLGLFIPLIVTNCAIIARAEIFAAHHPLHFSAIDGLAHGIGFTLVLVVLGFLREFFGLGTVFSDMEFLFGTSAASWEIKVHTGFLFALLPPGAFLVFALMVAGHRVLVTNKPAAKPSASKTMIHE